MKIRSIRAHKIQLEGQGRTVEEVCHIANITHEKEHLPDTCRDCKMVSRYRLRTDESRMPNVFFLSAVLLFQWQTQLRNNLHTLDVPRKNKWRLISMTECEV